MASRIVYVDFRGGMIDERMRRRSDLQSYYNSASLIENAVPTRSGGLRLRPGLVEYSDAFYGCKRIVPYIKSVDDKYIVVMSNRRADLYALSVSGKLLPVYSNVTNQYIDYEIPDVQYAQNGDVIVFSHKNHKPWYIREKDGLSYGDIELDSVANAYRTDGNDEEEIQYSYKELLRTDSDNPASVAFMANRLWMMSTINKPYKLWASRPFEPFNFQTEDKVQTVEEGLTVEQYLEAIKGNYEKVEEIKEPIEEYPDAVTVKTTVAYNADGTATKTVTYYDKDGIKVGQSILEAFKYTDPKYTWNDVVREDCAVEQELASDRDEKVQWIASMQNGLYIGTASSEWLIPSDFSAINMSVSKIGSFGSAYGTQCVYGTNSIFYIQSGRKRIRAINMSSDGISFSEPSYKCTSVISSGIKEMHWQRIPEPRLYCVLKDGTMAVLSYDQYYGIDAWSKWTFPTLSIVSMAIVDDPDEGQIAVVLAENKETAEQHIYRFSDDACTDNGIGFKAIVKTNNIEGDGTISMSKRNFNIYVDSFRTHFRAIGNSGNALTPRSFDSDLIKLDVYSSTTNEGLRMTIESIEGEPFELLALAIEVEVS